MCTILFCNTYLECLTKIPVHTLTLADWSGDPSSCLTSKLLFCAVNHWLLLQLPRFYFPLQTFIKPGPLSQNVLIFLFKEYILLNFLNNIWGCDKGIFLHKLLWKNVLMLPISDDSCGNLDRISAITFLLCQVQFTHIIICWQYLHLHINPGLFSILLVQWYKHYCWWWFGVMFNHLQRVAKLSDILWMFSFHNCIKIVLNRLQSIGIFRWNNTKSGCLKSALRLFQFHAVVVELLLYLFQSKLVILFNSCSIKIILNVPAIVSG